MEFSSLPPHLLLPFIDRIRKFGVEQYETYLHSLLLSVLTELMEFVPSEDALVLIDDPGSRKDQRGERELAYVAVAGGGNASLLGKRVHATGGIIGETYVLGKSTVRKAEKNEHLVIDRTHHPKEVNSLISVPLKTENSIIGVLQIFNKKDPVGFTIRDLKLVEIFAGYLSTSLQNAIDAHKSRELSKKDDLTGLFNDRYFHQKLESEVALADQKRSSLCLIFFDLDNFKSINDKYGHLVGSQTLKEIGFILREAVPFEHATLARYGGDEYVIVLPGIDLQRAQETGDLIRMMIAGKLFMIDTGEHDGSFINFKGILSCSVGVSSLHDHVPSGSVKDRKGYLIRLADQAMYKAKESGKNCVCIANPTTLMAK